MGSYCIVTRPLISWSYLVHVTVWEIYIFTFTKRMANKLSRVLNTGKRSLTRSPHHSSALFGWTTKRFFTNFSWVVTQETRGQDWTYFIEHTQRGLHKNCFFSCYSRPACHMTTLFMVTSIHIIRKKHNKQPETRKQVSFLEDRRFMNQKREKSSW